MPEAYPSEAVVGGDGAKAEDEKNTELYRTMVELAEEKFDALQDGIDFDREKLLSSRRKAYRARVLDLARRFFQISGDNPFVDDTDLAERLRKLKRRAKVLKTVSILKPYNAKSYLRWIAIFLPTCLVLYLFLRKVVCGEEQLDLCAPYRDVNMLT
mmetsp:Transcript_6916/g.20191  ORF Transcript_6916/g.20191 Transcript_6916/m.20191 type:complete len:156 (+) Transcript_6916:229-696(+)